MTSIPYFILIGIAILSSCKTPKNSTNYKKNPINYDQFYLNGSTIISCQNIDKICNDNIDHYPSMCFALSYDGKLLSTNQIIQGWGTSDCQAKKALFLETCHQNKNPMNIDQITCIPDPSNGECPIKTEKCPETKEPASCTLTRYNGMDLNWKQAPKSWGSNECEAKNLLGQKACKLNLIPSEIEKINCEPDMTDGECPNFIKNCPTAHQGGEGYICEIVKINNNNLEDPFIAYAPSLCEAKHAIYDIICQYTNSENKIKPSLVSDINCHLESK